MPRFVIDANVADSPKLEAWLAKSTSNVALITTAFAIETYRRRKVAGIKKSYGILSRYPKQLRVVKNQEELCRLHVKAKGMTARMFDHEGTVDLLELCRNFKGRTDSEIETAFSPLIRQADAQLEKLQQDSEGLGAEMAGQLDQLHESDLYALRTGAPYTSALIRDLLEQVVSKRSINRALSAGGEFRDACVHVNNVDICDAEQLRGIERIGGGAQA